MVHFVSFLYNHLADHVQPSPRLVLQTHRTPPDPPKQMGTPRTSPKLTALVLFFPRSLWRSCMNWMCWWYHSRVRSTSSRPCSRKSFSCSSSFMCFSCRTECADVTPSPPRPCQAPGAGFFTRHGGIWIQAGVSAPLPMKSLRGKG